MLFNANKETIRHWKCIGFPILYYDISNTSFARKMFWFQLLSYYNVMDCRKLLAHLAIWCNLVSSLRNSFRSHPTYVAASQWTLWTWQTYAILFSPTICAFYSDERVLHQIYDVIVEAWLLLKWTNQTGRRGRCVISLAIAERKRDGDAGVWFSDSWNKSCLFLPLLKALQHLTLTLQQVGSPSLLICGRRRCTQYANVSLV